MFFQFSSPLSPSPDKGKLLNSFYLNLRSTVLSEPGANPGGGECGCVKILQVEKVSVRSSLIKPNWTQFLEIKWNLLGKDITGKTREDSNHMNTDFPIKPIQSVSYLLHLWISWVSVHVQSLLQNQRELLGLLIKYWEAASSVSYYFFSFLLKDVIALNPI